MRLVLHGALAIAILTLGCAGCGVATDIVAETEPPMTPPSATPSTTSEPPPPAFETTITTTAVVSAVVISGPAVIERPQGTELFSLEWGTAPGQVWHDFWEQGAPSQNGFAFAMSPDSQTIAIYDYANYRVQLFTRDGAFQRAIPVSSTSAFADIAYDSLGRLFAINYFDSASQLPVNDGEESKTIPLVPGITPSELVTDGADVWVWAIGGSGAVGGSAQMCLTKIADEHGPLTSEGQREAGQLGIPFGAWPTGSVAFQVLWDNEIGLLITDRATGSTTKVPIVSPDLPLWGIRALGHDDSGNLYAMVEIYEENWEGTESWCFIGVSPEGTSLGQLRLPLDFWAGGGWAVTPYGTILEVSSTEAGITLTEYALKR